MREVFALTRVVWTAATTASTISSSLRKCTSALVGETLTSIFAGSICKLYQRAQPTAHLRYTHGVAPLGRYAVYSDSMAFRILLESTRRSM